MVPWQRQPSVVLETPENPLGYELPDLGLDENSDWTPRLWEFDEEHRSHMNELVKRFIRQVKESRGYDVDCFPPWWFHSPFYPRRDVLDEEAVTAAEFVVGKLNADTDTPDKTYKLVRIKKVVTTETFRYMLLTVTVKEVGPADADACADDPLYNGDGDGDDEHGDGIITYQATVDIRPGQTKFYKRVESKDYKLVELRVKVPVPDATAS